VYISHEKAKKMIIDLLPTTNVSKSGFCLACERKWKLKDPAYSNIGYFLRIK
jgi:hypothetical protein